MVEAERVAWFRVANLVPSGNFGAPPYVLLADMALSVPQAEHEPPPDAPRRKRAGPDGGGR